MSTQKLTTIARIVMSLCLGLEIFLMFIAPNWAIRLMDCLFALAITFMIVISHLMEKQHQAFMLEQQKLTGIAEALEEIRQLQEIWEAPDSEKDT